MAHLDAAEQHPVQRDEHRDLHQDGQAAAERVDLLGAVEIHHLLLHLGLVVAVHLLHALQARTQHAHLGHRLVARRRQREEDQLDRHRDQDDCPAPVAGQAVEPGQHPEQRRCDHGQPAVVDHQVEARRDAFELVLLLRTGVQAGGDRAFRARGDRGHRQDHAGGEQVVAERTGEILALHALLRQPGADEIVLHHRHPAIARRLRELGIAVGDVLELHLLELVGVGKERRSSEGSHAEGLDLLGRIAVAGELEIRMRRDRLTTLVDDLVGHVDQVATAMEGHHLGDLHAVLLGRAQSQFDRVLAVLQAQFAGRKLEHRLVVRQALTDQAGLGGVLVAHAAVVEQHEVTGRLAAGLVLLELEANDVAPLRRHFGAQQIGLDDHARGCARSCGLLTRNSGLAGRCSAQRGCGHGTVGRRGDTRGGLLRRHRRLVMLEPAVPQHDQRKGKNQEEDEAALIHRSRSVSGQGTGSYPPGLKG